MIRLVSVSFPVQSLWVKDPVLLQLWCGFSPWPGNYHMPCAAEKGGGGERDRVALCWDGDGTAGEGWAWYKTGVCFFLIACSDQTQPPLTIRCLLVNVCWIHVFYFLFFGFFFFFFRATLVAYGSSQARDRIGATAANLRHNSQQRILNPLSEARDGTCILMDTSWSHDRNTKASLIWA